jgi:hypothetical protein
MSIDRKKVVRMFMTIVYVALVFLLQLLLIAMFAVRWRDEKRGTLIGYAVYAMAFPMAIAGVLLWNSGAATIYWIGCLVFVLWAILGTIIDIIKPVEWRYPPRLPLFIPYVCLFGASLMLLWIPLWYIHPVTWIIYAVLYAIQTGFLIYAHSREAVAATPAQT